MRNLILILFCSGLFFESTLVAQSERCGTMEMYENAVVGSDAYKHKQELSSQIREYAQANPNARMGDVVLQIPLHVIIVHYPQDSIVGQGTNISEEQIMTQIEILNDDFRRLNADRIQTPSTFLDVAADTRIEFCLVAYDPEGQPTNGITRIANATSSFGVTSARNQLLPNILWDPDQYLNLVSCRLQGDLLGFAAFPGSPKSYDCVTIGDKYWGLHNNDAIYNLGRTATHEVGHYFGLYHIWSSCNPNDIDDDEIDDTPLQSSSSSGCPNHPKPSCTPADMFQNYMDYTNDACMNLFTQGQANVMRGFLLEGSRKSLLENFSAKCDGLIADFDVSGAQRNEICRGLPTDFINKSGVDAVTFEWTFEGGVPNTSKEENPSNIVFYEPGEFLVTLTVKDGDGIRIKSKQTLLSVVDGLSLDNLNEGALVLIPSENGGYISGHNGYEDKAKAEFFQAESGDFLSSLEFQFGLANGPANSTLKINIWDADGVGGRPNTILATTNIRIADIDISGPISVEFENKIALNGSFYAGFELNYDDGTSVAILTNEDGNTTPATAWEVLSNNTWKRFNEAQSWRLNIALAITARLACEEFDTTIPVAAFSVNDTKICLGEAVVFNNQSLFESTSFSWDFGDESEGSTDANPTHIYSEAGKYTVSLTASNAEGSDTETKVNLIEVFALPEIPEINQAGNVLASSITDAASYNWYLDGILIDGENESQLEVQSNGSYAVEIVDVQNCTSQSADFDFVVSGLFNSALSENLFSIYPNPANEEVEVRIYNNNVNYYNWKLIDIAGRTMMWNEVNQSQFKIDISWLNSGVYFLKIEDDNNPIGIKKLIIN